MRSVDKVMKSKRVFKDRMDEVLPREESDRAWQDAHSRLAKMYAAYPNLSKGVRAHTDSYIFPAAAIYLAIKVVAPEKAFEIMRDVMKEKTEKIGGMLGKMMKLPGFKRFFLKMWDTMSHKNFGPTAGFCNVFYPKEKDRFKMDITACPYHKYLTELGCPEINILFCDNDVYTYGNLPGMKFIRTKTLGAGDELCDFCMEMEEINLSNFFQNTCKPQGFGGKIMVNMMNSGHAKMAEWGFGFLKMKETDMVLDIGCGGGANIAYMLKKCTKGMVKGIDYSEVSVEKSRKVNTDAIRSGNCEVVCVSVMELPFETEQFDVITAFETVYFWPGLEEAFGQVYKVLKAGGTFMICNESCGKNQADEKWTKMIEGMVIYTAEQIKGYLEKAGFTDIKVQENEKGWLCVTAIKAER